MSKISIDVLRVPPAAVNLANTYAFEQIQVLGVSLAVDPDARSRIDAATGVGRMGAGGVAALPYLIAMLDQDRVSATGCGSVEVTAAFTSGSATQEDARKAENMARLAEADLACHIAASDALTAIGAPAVPALIDALRAGSPNRRSGAAKALGKIGARAEAALSLLSHAAKTDPSENVRKFAAEAIKLIKPRRWFSF